MIGGLLLIVLFEMSIAILDDRMYPPPFDGLRMKIKNRVAQRSGQDYDILILGDCFNIHGVDPLRLEDKTGLSTYNFATHAAQTVFADYVMLKNYLARNKPPRFIILHYLPESLVYDRDLVLKESVPHLFEFIGGNQPEFAREFGWPRTIQFMLPSLKQQAFLTRHIRERGLQTTERITNFQQFVYDTRGYYKPGKIVFRPQMYIDDRRYRKPVSPLFDKYLRKVLDLAAENDITVIYTMLTAPPQVYAMYTRAGMTQRYYEYFNGIRKEYPNIQFFNPRELLKDNRWYLDTTHLNRAGAARFTDFLAVAVQSQ